MGINLSTELENVIELGDIYYLFQAIGMEQYLRCKRDNESVYNQVNLVILGNIASGKTRLLRDLKDGFSSAFENPYARENDFWSYDSYDAPHVTVAVHSTRLACKPEKHFVLNKNVNLNFTDFDGQDFYELTCPLYLNTSNQLVLIAVNLNEYTAEKHHDMVTRWISLATSHIKGGEIIIVGTKAYLCSDARKEPYSLKM